jgi:DNA-binding transcriptional ArsR family regulator
VATPIDLDEVFHALADGGRRAMVERLVQGPAPVSELAKPLPISLPAVMQHLDVLQRSGLVRSEKLGRVRTCRLEQDTLLSVEAWLAGHRAVWEARLNRLEAHLERMKGQLEAADAPTSARRRRPS